VPQDWAVRVLGGAAATADERGRALADAGTAVLPASAADLREFFATTMGDMGDATPDSSLTIRGDVASSRSSSRSSSPSTTTTTTRLNRQMLAQGTQLTRPAQLTRLDRQMLALEALAGVMWPVAEGLLVVDRLAYLQQQPDVDASVMALFPPATSPRNWVLLAHRRARGSSQ
jgi:hypothetical protein